MLGVVGEDEEDGDVDDHEGHAGAVDGDDEERVGGDHGQAVEAPQEAVHHRR